MDTPFLKKNPLTLFKTFLLGLLIFNIAASFFLDSLPSAFTLLLFPCEKGFSPSLVFSLGFYGYLMWLAGSTIIERKKNFHTYLILALSLLLVAGQNILRKDPFPVWGIIHSLHALLLCWIFLFPQLEIFLFMVLALQGRHLVLFILVLDNLFAVAQGNWGYLSASALVLGFAYFYTLLVFGVSPRLPFLAKFDEWVIKKTHTQKILNDLSFSQYTKIYDLKTGKAVLNDEQFEKAMTLKKALLGKNSLSWSEKVRLKKISALLNRKS